MQNSIKNIILWLCLCIFIKYLYLSKDLKILRRKYLLLQRFFNAKNALIIYTYIRIIHYKCNSLDMQNVHIIIFHITFLGHYNSLIVNLLTYMVYTSSSVSSPSSNFFRRARSCEGMGAHLTRETKPRSHHGPRVGWQHGSPPQQGLNCAGFEIHEWARE
jgi:hypothetical protein